MARHGGVTFKSKKYMATHCTNPTCCPTRFSLGRRRPPETAHEGRFLLQVDRQTKESFQTREAAQKAGMALKKAYPILHVGILDVEEGQSEVIVPPSV